MILYDVVLLPRYHGDTQGHLRGGRRPPENLPVLKLQEN